jgi:sulfite exporter TauE/SafE
MCGAFVVGYTTKNAEKGHKGFKQHFVYGGAKVVSYAVIGGIFGLIGGVFAFSVGLRAGIAIFAGLFMIAFALSMLGVGFFKRLQVNPKFLSRWASKTSHDAKGFYKAPFMTGILSGLFIACGPLQALYLYAAGTGNFWTGFLSLGAFSLGTLPVLIGFGSLTSVISKDATKRILQIAAVLVLILGLIMLNRGLVVLGSDYSFEAIVADIGGVSAGSAAVISGDYQVINMEVDRYGWTPDTFTLKKGVPVKWNIDVKELTGCNNEIVVRDYDIAAKLESGMNVVEFTPDEFGTVRWSCWMGMIPGVFVVTDDGVATETQLKEASDVASSGGTCGGGCGCGG